MDTTWFRRLGEPSPGTPRLLCFPHAGGAAGAYAHLARRLSGQVDVLAVQYPGRQDRRAEAPVASIRELAERIAEKLVEAPGNTQERPYALFGHSMGAVVAYETVRLLRSGPAAAPTRLFLSGRAAPEPRPNHHDQLPDDQAILAAVRALGGTDAAVWDDPELIEMVLPALRADYRALARYSWQPGGVLDVPISVFIGDADPVVPVADVGGWAGQTAADSEVRVFAGGHFYLSEQLEAVAAAIVRRMEKSHGGSRNGVQDSWPAGSIGGQPDTDTRRIQAASGARPAALAGEQSGRHQRVAGDTVA